MVKGIAMEDIKPKNKKAILSHLQVYGASSRKKIAEKIKLTTATLTILSNELIEEGVVMELGELSEGKVGRKQIILDLNPESKYSLGLEISWNKVYFTIVNLKGEVIFQKKWEFEGMVDENQLKEVIEFIKLKIEDVREKILGIGVLVPGYVDDNQKWSMSIPNIKEQIENEIGIEAVLENNVRGLALSEIYSDREKRSFWLVKYGPGIGSSIVLNGNIVIGHRRIAGEIGHIVFKESEDECKVCGQKGCLESQIKISTLISKFDKNILNTNRRMSSETEFQYFYRLSEYDNYNILKSALSKLVEVLIIGHSILDSGNVYLAGEIFSNDTVYNWLLDMIDEKKGALKREMVFSIGDYKTKMRRASGALILRKYFRKDEK